MKEESKHSMTQMSAMSGSRKSKIDMDRPSGMSSSKQESSNGGSGSGSGSDSDEEDDEDAINFTNEDLIVSIKQLNLFLTFFRFQFQPESNQRKWLKTHGKAHCIDFEDEELRQLREYFGSLDDDGSGSIGTDELEEPLIALGLVDTRAQVDKIVMDVDDDGSGMLEFPEFLGIIKGGSNSNDGASDDGSGAIY